MFPCEGNHWGAVIAVCWLLHSVLEAWLGKTEKTKSGSMVELIIRGLVSVAGLILRRR